MYTVNGEISSRYDARADNDGQPMHYSEEAVGRLRSTITSYAAQGSQVWQSIRSCPVTSFGTGFNHYAQRLNLAVSKRREAAQRAYKQVAGYAPAVTSQWQQFDEVDNATAQAVKRAGDPA